MQDKNQYNDKNLRDGYWEEYYSSGTLYRQINYKNGKIEGKYQSYFEDGSRSFIGYWKNNEYIGFWQDFQVNDLIIYSFYAR